MRRLQQEFLDRTRRFAHRVVDVADAVVAVRKRSVITGRIVDQLVGAGASVGANVREADEAMCRTEVPSACLSCAKRSQRRGKG